METSEKQKNYHCHNGENIVIVCSGACDLG
jgi:hypothetical protein